MYVEFFPPGADTLLVFEPWMEDRGKGTQLKGRQPTTRFFPDATILRDDASCLDERTPEGQSTGHIGTIGPFSAREESIFRVFGR